MIHSLLNGWILLWKLFKNFMEIEKEKGKKGEKNSPGKYRETKQKTKTMNKHSPKSEYTLY